MIDEGVCRTAPATLCLLIIDELASKYTRVTDRPPWLDTTVPGISISYREQSETVLFDTAVKERPFSKEKLVTKGPVSKDTHIQTGLQVRIQQSPTGLPVKVQQSLTILPIKIQQSGIQGEIQQTQVGLALIIQ